MLKGVKDITVLDTKPIGSGAFSHVLRCRAAKDQKLYALKVVG